MGKIQKTANVKCPVCGNPGYDIVTLTPNEDNRLSMKDVPNLYWCPCGETFYKDKDEDLGFLPTSGNKENIIDEWWKKYI